MHLRYLVVIRKKETQGPHPYLSKHKSPLVVFHSYSLMLACVYQIMRLKYQNKVVVQFRIKYTNYPIREFKCNRKGFHIQEPQPECRGATMSISNSGGLNTTMQNVDCKLI